MTSIDIRQVGNGYIVSFGKGGQEWSPLMGLTGPGREATELVFHDPIELASFIAYYLQSEMPKHQATFVESKRTEMDAEMSHVPDAWCYLYEGLTRRKR